MTTINKNLKASPINAARALQRAATAVIMDAAGNAPKAHRAARGAFNRAAAVLAKCEDKGTAPKGREAAKVAASLDDARRALIVEFLAVGLVHPNGRPIARPLREEAEAAEIAAAVAEAARA